MTHPADTQIRRERRLEKLFTERISAEEVERHIRQAGENVLRGESGYSAPAYLGNEDVVRVLSELQDRRNDNTPRMKTDEEEGYELLREWIVTNLPVADDDEAEVALLISTLEKFAKTRESAVDIAQEEIEGYAGYVPGDMRWVDLQQSLHAVAKRSYTAGMIVAQQASRPTEQQFIEMQSDLVDTLSHVDSSTDPRLLAARVMARVRFDDDWESVEVEPEEIRCAICNYRGEYLRSPGGSWWAHEPRPADAPADGHDFALTLPDSDEPVPTWVAWGLSEEEYHEFKAWLERKQEASS